MALSIAQLQQYRDDGLIFLPHAFDGEEITALKAAQAEILAAASDTHLRAQSGEFLGTTAMDRVSPIYARLLRDERLLGLPSKFSDRGFTAISTKLF